MNPISQLDLHPDAESLNAFAEQALPEQEHAQVLAHIAACSRCRQIIYLAQEAAAGEEKLAPAAVGTEDSAIQRIPWFRSWRFAWAPAAAFTLIAGLAAVLYVRQTAPSTEVARIAAQNEGVVPAPAAPGPARAGESQSPVQHAAAKAPAKKLSPAPALNPQDALSLTAAAPVPAETGALELSNADKRTLKLQPNAPAQVTTAQTRYEPAITTQVPQQQGVAGKLVSNQLAANVSPEAPKSARQVGQASETVEVNANAVPIETERLPSPQLEVVTPVPAARLSAARAAKAIKLPSALPVISTAEARHTMLAIDAAGTLFLSEDSGKSWKPVPRQWTGQAMKVRIRQAPSSFTTTAGASAGSANRGVGGQVASPPNVIEFELVNDGNLTWMSADGKTWKAK